MPADELNDKVEFPGQADDRPEALIEAQSKEERKEKAKEHAFPDALTVYDVVAKAGVEEMQRPLTSLWWSGIAAGLGISISLFMMASLRVALEGVPGAGALEKFGYCFGFLIVVLGRLQLFTENTITPVLPAMHQRSVEAFKCVGRLWAVVFIANLVGTFFSASLPMIVPLASDEVGKAVLDISMHFAERTAEESFFTAIPAGFLVAAMVWMLPSSNGFEFWTIIAMTYAIALADTSHVIVGSTELFTVMLHGKMSVLDGIVQLAMTGAGNILGGTGLFALLAYAQVRQEI